MDPQELSASIDYIQEKTDPEPSLLKFYHLFDPLFNSLLKAEKDYKSETARQKILEALDQIQAEIPEEMLKEKRGYGAEMVRVTRAYLENTAKQ